MRLVEQNEAPEDHFTEGEPDLEPPEELALTELDDDALLEEELDNDDIAEEDVDEAVLEVTLEDLVHGADGEDGEDGELGRAAEWEVSEIPLALHVPASSLVTAGRARTDEPESNDETNDLELAELEDVEESLDHILAERLAGDADLIAPEYGYEEEVDEARSSHDVRANGAVHLRPDDNGSGVPTCREDEFVCRSCFLVLKRAQLADAAGDICRDCSL